MFFFKQKTAYEMRISDWSSDVCSSDLRPARPNRSPTSDERPAAEREKRQKEGAGGERDRQAEHDLDELAGAAAAVAEGERQAGDDNDHHRDDLGDRSLDGLADFLEPWLPGDRKRVGKGTRVVGGVDQG